MITMKSISFMACTILLQASEKRQVVTANLQVQQYSFPPNNTPISKVYIFGRPIYVRQPFVLPQRDIYRSRIEQKDEGAFSVQALEKSNTESRDDLLNNAFEKQLYGDTNPTRYYLPERPYTTPYDTVREPVYTQTKTIYPLPQCYTNDSGFMCCNSELEQVMKDVLNELTSDSKWQSCNVQKIANVLQNRIQSTFNTDFEVMVGLGDFASKIHFFSDLICKIEVQDRFVLSYATPSRHEEIKYPTLPYSLETSSTPYL